MNSESSNDEHVCEKCGNSISSANGSAKSGGPSSLYDVQIARENSDWRIHEEGPGAEIVRRIAVKRLKGLIDLLYEHGSIADIVVLCDALEKVERRQVSIGAASLVESFLSILGVDPLDVLAKP